MTERTLAAAFWLFSLSFFKVGFLGNVNNYDSNIFRGYISKFEQLKANSK